MASDVDRLRDSGDLRGLLLNLFDHIRPIADPVEIAGEACRLLVRWLDVDRAYYVEIDEATGRARVDRDCVSDGVASVTGEYELSDFEWTVDILRRGECQVMPDTRTSPLVPDEDRAAPIALDIIASMCAPVIKGGTLVGALCVTASHRRDWTQTEVTLLQEVADRTWSAVQRAHAERTLDFSEARYRTLVNAMDAAVCVFERLPSRPDGPRDYRYISMNPAMQAMFGVQDLSGQSIRDNFPDEAEGWYDDYDRVLETGEPLRLERGSVTQGKVLDMFITRIEDHQSGPTLMAVIRDVTKRKRAEDALRASEGRLRALVNATSEVVYRMSPDWHERWDLDGRGVVQDKQEPTTGWLSDYIAPDDRPRVMAAVAKAIETKSPFQMEHRVKRPDGSQGWTFTRAIPLIDDAGDIVEWFGAASDITERRQTVEALMYTQRLDAIGRLAGAIAHDFNNLLTVIIANIELAELRSSDEVVQPFLDNAMKAAQLGKGINQRLLSWAGKSPTQRRVVILNDLVEDLSKILDRSLGERIVLTLDLTQGLWPILVDPAHIDSALLNLVVNARDAMPQGGEIRLASENVTVTPEKAAAVSDAKPGDYVCLSITDTGEGMTEEVRRRALEPFFSTKGHGTGVGLGLFSVQTMVHQFGGFLEFESQLGQGTVFRLYFPREEASAAERRQPAAIDPPTRETRIRVLLVEDQHALRDVTRERLQTLGYDVVEAKDAEEALARLRADPEIRVLFSDIVMPGDLSGRDLVRRVLSDRAGIAVLLTSGYSAETAPLNQDDPTASVPLLIKPYSLAELAEALEQILGKAAQEAPSRAG